MVVFPYLIKHLPVLVGRAKYDVSRLFSRKAFFGQDDTHTQKKPIPQPRLYEVSCFFFTFKGDFRSLNI